MFTHKDMSEAQFGSRGPHLTWTVCHITLTVISWGQVQVQFFSPLSNKLQILESSENQYFYKLSTETYLFYLFIREMD